MCNRRWATLVALVFACSLVHAAPQTGWWWNPSESGRGFFVESDGTTTFVAGYFYADNGRARWLVAGGGNTDPYNYSGPLLEFHGGQTLTGDYVAPSPSASPGNITLHFSDDTHGTLAWPGGTIAIQRLGFGTGTPDFQPFAGWWWNPDESGRGYSLELQGNTLFIAAYMYDTGGNPVWYISSGAMSSPTTYDGPWLQFANGQTMTGPYHPPSPPLTVGTVSIEFTAADEANIALADTTASDAKTLAPKRSKTFRIKPLLPKCTPPRATFPTSFAGSFVHRLTAHDTTSPFLDVNYTVTVTGVLDFEAATLAPPLGPFGKDACGKPIAFESYVVTGSHVDVEYDYTSSNLPGHEITCHQKTLNPKVFNVPADLDLDSLGVKLYVSSYNRYQLSLNIPENHLNITVIGECATPAGTYAIPNEAIDSVVVITGTNAGAVAGGIHGGGTTTSGEVVRHFRWDFAGS